MRALLLGITLFSAVSARAVTIDRIAVVVGTSIIKDSDIERDIRVTDFLNGRAIDLSPPARKQAAQRLLDQIFVRREIQLGDYPIATLSEADEQLNRLKKERFQSNAAFEEALQRDGLSELELRTQFQWQLTVLRFIDARFKPAVLITDQEIEKYRQEHTGALSRQFPNASADDLRDSIRSLLTSEQVNRQFFAWLEDQRKSSKISYREGELA